MRKLVTLLVLFLACAPVLSREPDAARQLVDRAAIHEVMQKYVWSVDALDADGYVSVFTEDAEVDSNGIIHKGHAQIRATEALYQSYWQTMRKGQDNRYVAGGFGRSEDHLVKRNGQWLIKSRKLVVFTD